MPTPLPMFANFQAYSLTSIGSSLACNVCAGSMAVGVKRLKLVVGDRGVCRSTIIFHQRRVAQLMLDFKKTELAFMPVVM
jgi:hypothetical protein